MCAHYKIKPLTMSAYLFCTRVVKTHRFIPYSLMNTFDVTKYSLRSSSALASLFNFIHDYALSLFVFCWVESRQK